MDRFEPRRLLSFFRVWREVRRALLGRFVTTTPTALPGMMDEAFNGDQKYQQSLPPIYGDVRRQYAPRKMVTTVRTIISTSNQIDQLSI
jgi:hypothetical protein